MPADRTLYYVNGSIPNWRVAFALHAKQLAFTPRRLRVMQTPRETKSPAFLAVNPRGKTPVLVDDGAVVCESFAILHYLERRYPTPALLPPPSDGAALARTLAFAHEAEVTAEAYDPIEMLFTLTPETASAHDVSRVAHALDAVAFELDLWESRVPDAPAFVASPALSLADCALYPTLAYMERRGLPLAGHPKLASYLARVRETPPAVASQPEGWLPGRRARVDLFARARALVGA